MSPPLLRTPPRRRKRPPKPKSPPPEEDEEEEEEEEAPDLPIWFGILLIVICILSCAAYFTLTEAYAFGHSVYYSFLFFLAGDFYTDQYDLAVPTYCFLFLGFATVSTTINIVMYNIENMINRVKKNLDKEIKELQEKIERGEIQLEEGVNAEDMIEEILKKSAPAYLRATLPKGKLAELKVAAQAETERVVEEIKEERAFQEELRQEAEIALKKEPTPPPTPVPKVPLEDRECQTDPEPKPETPPPSKPIVDTTDAETQCEDPPLLIDIGIGDPRPETQATEIQVACDVTSIASGPNQIITAADQGSQAVPETVGLTVQASVPICTRFASTDEIITRDVAGQSRPKTRTVKTQFPKGSEK